jgi:hypothetical protein
MKNILILACLLVFSASQAQDKSEALYRKSPLWIEMMNTPHVQYAEAVRAFDIYWSTREKPAGEHDMLGASNAEKKDRDFVTKKKKKGGEAEQYAVEYKAFMHWKEKMAPYVKPNGEVMDANDRLQYWETQQKNKR